MLKCKLKITVTYIILLCDHVNALNIAHYVKGPGLGWIKADKLVVHT